MVNEQIKHNLPLAILPERKKYKMFKTKTRDEPKVPESNRVTIDSSPSVKSIVAHAETQTETVTFMIKEDKDLFDLLKKENSTIQKITQKFLKKCCDAETNTDNVLNFENVPKTNDGEHSKQVLPCSHLNNILMTNHGGLGAIANPNIVVPNRVHHATNTKSNEEENLFDRAEIRTSSNEQQTDKEDKIIKKRRRVSLSAMSYHNYAGNERQISTQIMYQREQYHNPTAMSEGQHYINANIANNMMYPNQYQVRRTQCMRNCDAAEEPLHYYNTDSRMMQTFSVQYTRERFTQYADVPAGSWNYPQVYADHASMLQQTMPGDVHTHTAHATVNGPQTYRYRSAMHISNYTGTEWGNNMMPNNFM